MNLPKIMTVAIRFVLILLSCSMASGCGNAGRKDRNVPEGIVIYVGTYGENLYRYIFDVSDRSFIPLGQAAVKNPSYLALGEENYKDGIYDLYAVSENGTSSAVFSFADDIGMTETGGVSLTGTDPCFLFFDRPSSTLITAEYGSGSISVFAVNDDGSVGEKTDSLWFHGSGPVAARQESSHIHQVAFLSDDSASGRFLLATDLGADRIRVMKVTGPAAGEYGDNGKGLGLTYLPELDVECGAGSGPRHMAIDVQRRRLYCITEISGELLVFRWAFGEDGLPVFSLADRILADEAHGEGSADIHLHPSGKFLYTSHRLKKDGISVFSVSDDGTVVKTGYCRTGKHPRNFAITPDGKMMLVACRDDMAVEVYDIDGLTGELSPSGQKLKFDKDMPSCVRVAE